MRHGINNRHHYASKCFTTQVGKSANHVHSNLVITRLFGSELNVLWRPWLDCLVGHHGCVSTHVTKYPVQCHWSFYLTTALITSLQLRLILLIFCPFDYWSKIDSVYEFMGQALSTWAQQLSNNWSWVSHPCVTSCFDLLVHKIKYFVFGQTSWSAEICQQSSVSMLNLYNGFSCYINNKQWH